MIALLQRVTSAHVTIAGETVARISDGLLALIGIQPLDTAANGIRLLDRMLKYRIFADDSGKMNVSLQTMNGGLLLVPQFTLAADTRRGLRPGFSTAASPELGRVLFDDFVRTARERHPTVETGRFGATMQVGSINDGPVTFWVES